MTWRPFEPSLDAVRRANRCAWHDDCSDADRWAKVLGKPASVHDPIEVDNPPMLAPPDAEIENGRVVACASLQPERMRRAREMAGLSLGQAGAMLRDRLPGQIGDDCGCSPCLARRLDEIETGTEPPTDDLIRDMSALYGVAVGWLRGADPVIQATIAGSGSVTFREGDRSWHDGPGWYYTTGPGALARAGVWTGAFPSRVLAEQHARLAGHDVEIEGPTDADMIGSPDPIDGDDRMTASEPSAFADVPGSAHFVICAGVEAADGSIRGCTCPADGGEG